MGLALDYNDDGNVTDRFSYGPYGELLTHTGTTSTTFLYNGRDGVMTDTNGLYFLRSRYYNPDIKRFISRDEFEGRYDEILNVNFYEYANNNPVMNTDPEGEFIPLVIGAAYLAYRAWSAYDTYQDVKGAYQDYRSGNYGGLAERAVLIGAGVAFGKAGKTAIKLARHTKMAGKVFKASKRLGKAVHANSLKTTKKAIGYTLRDMETGDILKYGETTRGYKRYTKKFLKEQNAEMNIETKGTKREMHYWQHEKILQHKANYGSRPRLNKSDW